MAVAKIDPKVIFASEAPAQDAPAVFTNKTVGWGESRKNGGRPTIKQSNALQQETDLKILWLNENSVTPFDSSIDYPENAVTIKDGSFKIFNGTSWINFLDKSSVGLGNVDNTSDLNKPISTAVKTELDYIGKNGAALPYKEGIAYEENAVVVKDGELQQWKGGEWVNVNSQEVKKYLLAAGVDESELDGDYDFLMQRLAQIAVDEGWDAAFVVDASGLNQQEINNQTLEKFKRENVSVWDFFTSAELKSYKASPTTFDAWRPVQEFFDYIRLNGVSTAYCSGVFRVSQSVKCGLAGATLTKSVTGDLTLYALNAIDTLFDAQVGSDFVWTGSVKVYGTGSGEYSTRTCRAGIRLGGNADRSTWGMLRAQYFYELGVQFYNKTTLAQVGRIRCFDCGSGYDNATSINYSLRSSYTHNTNTGSSSSASQRSVLNVAVLPPADLDANAYVVINNRAYWISAIDRTASTITVFPWIDSNYLSGDLRYIFGAGVDVFGGDASLLNISAIDTMRCGVSYSSRTLYPATIGILTTQANGVGLSVGSRADSASIGGCISQFYTELNNFDIFPLSRAAQNFEILNTTALNYSKINYFAPRSTSNVESYAFYGLTGFIVGGIDGFQMVSKTPRGVNTATTLNLTSPNLKHIHRKATSVFNLYYDQALNDAYGYDATELTVIGTAANNLPTSVTFNPDSGRTVNGQASVVFNSFSKIPNFNIFFDIATNNYIVINMTATVQASVTYDPPALATATQQSTTVTLSGAKLGDTVNVAFNKALNGTRMWAEATATDAVTVYHRNDTGASVDLVSGTLTVKVV